MRAAADRCRCYTAVCCPSKKNWGGGRKVEKVPPPYYCTSAGHHVLGKKCVFIAGSFLKKSVCKAGTTVFVTVVNFCALEWNVEFRVFHGSDHFSRVGLTSVPDPMIFENLPPTRRVRLRTPPDRNRLDPRFLFKPF